ncbi:TIGR01777 family oxidoreductase [Desulforudis sp. 1088]|uniref:TIGR01777 family oxidoreductase n=2 Tax=Candidatus Desulforudis TaxID=471826 RepID=UPI003CE5528E
MKVVVTGGTGFIGRPLVASFLDRGDEVTVLTRSKTGRLPAGVKAVTWPAGGPAASGEEGGIPPGEAESRWWEALDGADAVVHLAGESIAARRWTPEQKERIRESRVQGTRVLVETLARVKRRPGVLVSGSAVGYYGPRGDEELTEADAPGQDFLSEVCTAWEREARQAEILGMRVVLLRTGMVLERDGGALPRMLLPFRWFAGGPFGSGRQWMSWIHRDDLVSLIRFLIANKEARGPVNAVAPNPVTNLAFARTLGRMMRRPSRLAVPRALLRLALGEMAEALLLSGQRAVPARALELGFSFKYAELETALQAILKAGK